VESSHDAIIGKGLDGVVTSWNAGAEKLYGYTSADIVGKSISLLVPPDRHDEVPAILRRVSRGELIREFETVRARKDGTRVDVSLTVSPIRSRDGTVVGASTVARDISDRLRYQNQLMFLAQHDAMTGAHNRLSFEREVGDQVVRARRYGESAVVAIIDLDNFKHINDTYGHASGDQALKAVASILHQRLRQTDFVARIGGDEFAIILPYASADQGVAVTADVQRLINECNVEASHDPVLCLSASVGLAHIDKDAVSAEAILIEADAAMYADKRRTAA
jgi:diguanylate cyclase (GGDEF)-like protein/PAS domain S-box-containing protein